jgi:hypothetical protein
MVMPVLDRLYFAAAMRVDNRNWCGVAPVSFLNNLANIRSTNVVFSKV